MNKKNMAILGCGDFLRCEKELLLASKRVTVHSLYDPEIDRAEKYAEIFGGRAVGNSADIFEDPEIDIIALFVPPWIRKDLLAKAARQGKQVITTKPLASTTEDCQAILDAAEEHGIKVALIYGRTESPMVESARDLFAEGRFGRLALYKQDWLHAYPKWNKWATDPVKNGGPFMDAMIHNLNAACYLMDRPIARSTFFSGRLAHPDLTCADTESMVLEFEGGGMADLFITWAADLETYGTDGNYREHIDLFYMITDQGWRITREYRNGASCLVLSKEGKKEVVPCPPLDQTPYDSFVAYMENGDLPRNLVGLKEAIRDIHLVLNQT